MMTIRLLTLAFFAVLLSACGGRAKMSNTPPLPRPVRVIRVEALGNITKQYTGTVEAQEFSTLAFKIPGTLSAFPVQEGQKVKKGQLIARIKNFDYEKQYETASANYKTAEAIYKRTQNLYAAKAVAKQNLEIAEADYIQATSALNIAESTLGYTNLYAPFNGFIEKQFVENYEEVLPGQAIVQLVNPENIKIRFVLPENNTQLLEVPKKIYVEFDSQKGSLFSTEIKEYIYASDGSGIPITLNVTDEAFARFRENVFPGFSCKVTFHIDNMISDKFVIPSSALFAEKGKHYVWVVDPTTSTTQKRQIEIEQYRDLSLVESGLHSDDLIVTAGITSIREGQTVRAEVK